MYLFLSSYLIGFTAAFSLGPIAVLCIQRTLKHGWRRGVASGFGVALADGAYGLLGALGLSAVTSVLVENQVVLQVGGGLVLVYLGVKAFFGKSDVSVEAEESGQKPGSLLSAGCSIFLLTLSNPMTILFFSAVYAGVTISGNGVVSDLFGNALLFPLGVTAGSFTWWVILASLVSALRTRFRPAQLVWLNRVSGVLIAGFGVWVIWQGIID